MIAVARTADMVLMMLDATKGDKQRYSDDPLTFSMHVRICLDREILEDELETVGIRLNRRKPDIYFKVRACVTIAEGHDSSDSLFVAEEDRRYQYHQYRADDEVLGENDSPHSARV